MDTFGFINELELFNIIKKDGNIGEWIALCFG